MRHRALVALKPPCTKIDTALLHATMHGRIVLVIIITCSWRPCHGNAVANPEA